MEEIEWMEQKHDTTMLHNEPKNDFVIQSVNNASVPSRFFSAPTTPIQGTTDEGSFSRG